MKVVSRSIYLFFLQNETASRFRKLPQEKICASESMTVTRQKYKGYVFFSKILVQWHGSRKLCISDCLWSGKEIKTFYKLYSLCFAGFIMGVVGYCYQFEVPSRHKNIVGEKKRKLKIYPTGQLHAKSKSRLSSHNRSMEW